jgi:hypothetical protein
MGRLPYRFLHRLAIPSDEVEEPLSDLAPLWSVISPNCGNAFLATGGFETTTDPISWYDHVLLWIRLDKPAMVLIFNRVD